MSKIRNEISCLLCVPYDGRTGRNSIPAFTCMPPEEADRIANRIVEEKIQPRFDEIRNLALYIMHSSCTYETARSHADKIIALCTLDEPEREDTLVSDIEDILHDIETDVKLYTEGIRRKLKEHTDG